MKIRSKREAEIMFRHIKPAGMDFIRFQKLDEHCMVGDFMHSSGAEMQVYMFTDSAAAEAAHKKVCFLCSRYLPVPGKPRGHWQMFFETENAQRAVSTLFSVGGLHVFVVTAHADNPRVFKAAEAVAIRMKTAVVYKLSSRSGSKKQLYARSLLVAAGSLLAACVVIQAVYLCAHLFI